MSVSPLTIRMMLACYVSPDPEGMLPIEWTSNSGNTVRAWLAANDLLGDDFRPTARGNAWVEFICNTPLPVTKWILPERSE